MSKEQEYLYDLLMLSAKISIVGVVEEEKSKDKIFVSVPEIINVDFEGNELHEPITGEMILPEIKKMIFKGTFEALKKLDDSLTDDEGYEIYDELMSEVKFYAKIRKGEVWTKENAQSAMEEFMKKVESLKEYSGYREI